MPNQGVHWIDQRRRRLRQPLAVGANIADERSAARRVASSGDVDVLHQHFSARIAPDGQGTQQLVLLLQVGRNNHLRLVRSSGVQSDRALMLCLGMDGASKKRLILAVHVDRDCLILNDHPPPKRVSIASNVDGSFLSRCCSQHSSSQFKRVKVFHGEIAWC